ncbi:hypothetical protein [Frankia gtarii]|uniref:hypothetical protein n=1 Tax=Frankia gtarii TaxID=2950102 RepID=UPI0021C22F6B|nr:hypothetical protein [Frankia gtarii]
MTVGVGALVYGISDATSRGWGSTPVVSALVAATVLPVAFGLVETRSPAPLAPFGIFRNRRLGVANAVIACVGWP